MSKMLYQYPWQMRPLHRTKTETSAEPSTHRVPRLRVLCSYLLSRKPRSQSLHHPGPNGSAGQSA
jgi:hypothetical protein